MSESGLGWGEGRMSHGEGHQVWDIKGERNGKEGVVYGGRRMELKYWGITQELGKNMGYQERDTLGKMGGGISRKGENGEERRWGIMRMEPEKGWGREGEV